MRRFPNQISVLCFLFVLFASGCGDESPPADDAGLTDEPIPVEPDGGIGDTPLGDIPFFGSNDTLCPSLVLTNDIDDPAKMRAAVPCLLDAVDAGTPVVWDVSIPTVEGDPIYHRFHFDGDEVVIVRDDRADTFGVGTVRAERCASLTWPEEERLPVGVECVSAEHPGFPEAEAG